MNIVELLETKLGYTLMHERWRIKDTEVIKPWYPRVAGDKNALSRQTDSNPMAKAFYNVTGLINQKLVK